MIRLVVPYEFQAEHAGLFSKEGTVQHDRFKLEIVLEVPHLPDGLAVLPIERLDVDVRPVLARVKGKRLDALLDGKPTTENLALYFRDALQFLRPCGFTELRLTETDEAGRSWTVEVSGWRPVCP